MESCTKGASQMRLALQVLIGVALIWWYLFWFIQPISTAVLWIRKVDKYISQDFLGTRGSTWLLQVFPFMVVTILSYCAIALKRRMKPSTSKVTGKPRVNIWSQPLITRSPLGMLTLGDIVFLVLNVSLIIWYITKMSVDRSNLIDASKLKKGAHSRAAQKLENIGIYFGKAALIPFALLWIPVSRASPFLRLSGVPFERAVKYHTWLGLICIWILIFHGILMFTYFFYIHHPKELLSWANTGIAVFPGIIALGAGLLMLLTALQTVRRNHFNFFYFTHHLYLVFLLFFLFHCVSQMVYVVTPILLFFLDRFIRMIQSRTSVDILSTRVLPSGAIELKFAKPEDVEYHALSFMYILVPSVSQFEWHPFSVASSPLDQTNQICIYIKPLGGYTKDIHDALIETKQNREVGKLKCPFGFKLHLEGPYGDESNFYLRYDSLVLVAGGIGVTPFLAILQDILYRHKLHLAQNLPSSVHLILCVRHAKDLSILDTINPCDILPNYTDAVKITIQAYVTSRDLVTDVEMNSGHGDPAAVISYEHFRATYLNEPPKQFNCDGPPLEVVRKMSSMSGAGNVKWIAATFCSSFTGYIVIFGIFNITGTYTELMNYGRAMVYCVILFLAVVGCGGPVLLLWTLISRMRSPPKSNQVQISQSSPAEQSEASSDETTLQSMEHDGTSWVGNVTFGRRPDWKELFDDMAKQYADKKVGVLVSGSSKMQEDVAAECVRKRLSKSRSDGCNVAFSYHSVSFEL
ncbi:hypothetical protein R1sor_019402 [Riccia sorocarpa]|uniref:FAD-binding FR-type domain-containing protein n=1 Tax=Riccia sorocarpa TaxID=122646 RepID=A0ABD3IG22_9MARC